MTDAVTFYNPAADDYDFAKDPRCLWGWGDCGHQFGHACFRAFGHPGKCWDGGDQRLSREDDCARMQRPRNWDSFGREETNR